MYDRRVNAYNNLRRNKTCLNIIISHFVFRKDLFSFLVSKSEKEKYSATSGIGTVLLLYCTYLVTIIILAKRNSVRLVTCE